MNETVEKFEDLTKYNLDDYLNDFVTFMDNDQQSIIDFYQGLKETPDTNAFNELNRLRREAKKITEIIILNKDGFITTDFWDLVDTIEEVNIVLESTNNFSVWARSAVTLNNYNNQVEVDSGLQQNQSLEKMAEDVGYEDFNNNWTDIAIRNRVKEEDYDNEGGNILKISFQRNQDFKIDSVVDNISGKNVYGVDIDKSFAFENDDIKFLTPDETIKQAFKILLGLKKRDNLEFPTLGIDKSSIVGQNLASITYPILFRQLYNTFVTDDTLKSIAITNIEQVDDRIEIEVRAETRLNEVVTDIIPI